MVRILWSILWRAVTLVLAIIGLSGIPDNVRTWGEWLKALDRTVDAWQEHSLFSVLIWAISVIALTSPQWLSPLRKRSATERARRNYSEVETQSVTAPQARESAHLKSAYTAQTPDQVLQGLAGLTSIEAERIGEIHLGLRTQASGVIKDVESDLQEDGTKPRVWLHTDQGSDIRATFADAFEAQVRTLTPGMPIQVDGEIWQVGIHTISLRDSHLILNTWTTAWRKHE